MITNTLSIVADKIFGPLIEELWVVCENNNVLLSENDLAENYINSQHIKPIKYRLRSSVPGSSDRYIHRVLTKKNELTNALNCRNIDDLF